MKKVEIITNNEITRLLEIEESLNSFWYSTLFVSIVASIMLGLAIFVGMTFIQQRGIKLTSDNAIPLVLSGVAFIGLLILIATSNDLKYERYDVEEAYFETLKEQSVEVETTIIHSVEVDFKHCLEVVTFEDKCFFVKFKTDNEINQVFIKSQEPIKVDDKAIATIKYVDLSKEDREFLTDNLDISSAKSKYGLDLGKWSLSDEIEYK